MATLELKNISRTQGLELLKNVKSNLYNNYKAINSNKKYYEYTTNGLVYAFLSPVTKYNNGDDIEDKDIDYSICNFKIHCNCSQFTNKDLEEIANL